jgi:hypothetical protein
MRRSKKLIIIAVLATVVLAGSIGGVALAQTGNGDDCGPKAKFGELFGRVCEIYEQETGVAIDQEALKDAFTQAQGEMRPEDRQDGRTIDPEAMQDRLQELLEQGEITQEQFDKMKARMESMPDDLPGFGFHGHCGFPGMGGAPFGPAE